MICFHTLLPILILFFLHQTGAHDFMCLVIPCGLYVFWHFGHAYDPFVFFIRASVAFLRPAPRATAASSALLLSAPILYPWMISLMFFCTGPVVMCLLMRPRHFSRSRVSLLQFQMPSLSMSFIRLDAHRFRMPPLLGRLSSEMNENILFFASDVSPSSFSNLLT